MNKPQLKRAIDINIARVRQEREFAGLCFIRSAREKHLDNARRFGEMAILYTSRLSVLDR